MNDYSSEISAAIVAAVKKRFPKCFFTLNDVPNGKHLPAMAFEYSFPDSAVYIDSSGIEKWTHTKLVVDAYSGTSLQEAKDMIQAADEELGRLGFRRSNWVVAPNADASIRRVQATYRASVGADGCIAAW